MPDPNSLPGQSAQSDWRWYCMPCGSYVDVAPCPYCGAGHDEIAVLEPGCEPPTTEQEQDEAATIDDFEWPAPAYAS